MKPGDLITTSNKYGTSIHKLNNEFMDYGYLLSTDFAYVIQTCETSYHNDEPVTWLLVLTSRGQFGWLIAELVTTVEDQTMAELVAIAEGQM